jgi:hypothetical protein
MLSRDILTPFIGPLEKNKILYFVTGSIASIFYGEPRLTHDVDIVLHLSQSDAVKFSTLFPLEQFYCPPEEVIQIESKRRPYGHFNLIHHATGFKADIYADAGDQLHQWAFEHRKHIELTKDLMIWLAPPEYVIIRKLEYFREGGSQKHLDDITKMLTQVEESLNAGFLQNEVDARGLKAVWKQIRDA